jgi:acetyltransferase-like isoleucine patch superfamily enzyme
MIEKIIRKLKNDPNYKLDSNYSIKDMLLIIYGRLKQIGRGFFKKLFLKRATGLLFSGRNVTIKHGYLFQAGKNLILEDDVFINALSYNGITLGDNVSMARGCTLICTGVIANKGIGISIGDNTGINSGVFIGGQGGVTIGNNVIIGPGTKIFSENHNFQDIAIPIKDQGVTRKGVNIKNNCWIGAGVTILDGVTIEEGCIIAAGSVVNKNVDSNSIIAGVPGKLIKKR